MQHGDDDLLYLVVFYLRQLGVTYGGEIIY